MKREKQNKLKTKKEKFETIDNWLRSKEEKRKKEEAEKMNDEFKSEAE